MARKYSNTSVETTLVSGINSSTTSIQVNDTGGLPSTFPYSLVIDYEGSTVEVVSVTDLSGGTLTVTRGQDGTAAQSHDAGAVVVHGVTARDLSEPQVHIDATDEVHGLSAGSSLVGTAEAQVLTNKTIAFDDNTLTDVASVDTAQTLTNKTITAASNTLTINLDDLADVDAASPSDGEVLTYDNGAGDWTPAVAPGTTIARTRNRTAGSNLTDTESVELSVTGTLVNGHTYLIKAYFTFDASSGVAGTRFNTRIREDSLGGSTVQSGNHIVETTSNLGEGFYIEGEYDAVASGSKTFVFTCERQLQIGNGTVIRKGATGFWPNTIRIEYQDVTA